MYKIHKIAFFVHTVRTERGDFMQKKELTEAEKSGKGKERYIIGRKACNRLLGAL